MIENLYNLGFDLPFKLGEQREEVVQKIGPADVETIVDRYDRFGFILWYNIYETLDQIIATTLQSGSTYKGVLFGVKIGDMIQTCINLWGEPSYTDDKKLDFKTHVWNFGEINKTGSLIVSVEYWTESGEQDDFGMYVFDQVKSIKIQFDDQNPEII